MTKSINKFFQQWVKTGKNYKSPYSLYQTIFEARYTLHLFT